ncbi:MAG: hypothetical protein QM770_17825 [Tepidisphaeraceae bacterium]
MARSPRPARDAGGFDVFGEIEIAQAHFQAAAGDGWVLRETDGRQHRLPALHRLGELRLIHHVDDGGFDGAGGLDALERGGVLVDHKHIVVLRVS